MSEWRPIESAPRDFGTRIIMGFAADEEGYSPPSYEGFWSEADQQWRMTSDPSWKSSPQPTHWMPLPAPPKEPADER